MKNPECANSMNNSEELRNFAEYDISTQYSDFISHLLTDASAMANYYFGSISSSVKKEDNNQVLTEADIEIGKMMIRRITQTYPLHNIINEESDNIDKKSDFTWVIDPIDGTSNFAYGSRHFGIYVGVLGPNDIPIAGGVAIPSFGDIFIAEKGVPTRNNGQKVLLSPDTLLLNSLIAYGIDGHQEDPQITRDEGVVLVRLVLGIRNLRSSNCAFDLGEVLKGVYGAYINGTSKIWDNVGPQIVIEEAGGIFTDIKGKPINYYDPLNRTRQNYTNIATTKNLHPQLVKILNVRN